MLPTKTDTIVCGQTDTIVRGQYHPPAVYYVKQECKLIQRDEQSSPPVARRVLVQVQ